VDTAQVLNENVAQRTVLLITSDNDWSGAVSVVLSFSIIRCPPFPADPSSMSFRLHSVLTKNDDSNYRECCRDDCTGQVTMNGPMESSDQASTVVATMATTTPSAVTAVHAEQPHERSEKKQKSYKNQFSALLNRCQIIQQVKFNVILSAVA
jgi:hypothetical protein